MDLLYLVHMLGKRLIYLLLNMSIIEQMVVINIPLVVYLSVVNNNLTIQFGKAYVYGEAIWTYPLTVNTLFSISTMGRPDNIEYNVRDFVLYSFTQSSLTCWFSDNNSGDAFFLIIGKV